MKLVLTSCISAFSRCKQQRKEIRFSTVQCWFLTLSGYEWVYGSFSSVGLLGRCSTLAWTQRQQHCHGFAILRLQNWGLELSTTSQGYPDPKAKCFFKIRTMSQIDRVTSALVRCLNHREGFISRKSTSSRCRRPGFQIFLGRQIKHCLLLKYGNESNSKCFLEGGGNAADRPSTAAKVKSNLSNSKPLLLPWSFHNLQEGQRLTMNLAYGSNSKNSNWPFKT